MKPVHLAVALVCFGASLVPAATAAASTLRLCHNSDESFPWIMKVMPGFSQILATDAARNLKLDLQLHPMNWNECLQAVRQGQMDGAISVAFVAERLDFLVYPMSSGGKPDTSLRMYNNSFSLYHRKAEKIAWDGRTLVVKGSIGMRQGSSIGTRLKALGASADTSSTNYVQLMRRLAKGEFAAAAVETIEGHENLVQDFNLRSAIEPLPEPLLVEPFFTAFGKGYAQKNAALIKAFWMQQQKLRQTPEFAAKVRHLVKKID